MAPSAMEVRERLTSYCIALSNPVESLTRAKVCAIVALSRQVLAGLGGWADNEEFQNVRTYDVVALASKFDASGLPMGSSGMHAFMIRRLSLTPSLQPV